MKNNFLKKFISIMMIFAILISSMPNWRILNDVVYAANSEQAKMIVKSEMEDFDTIGDNKIFKITVCLQNVSTNSWSIYMQYNSDKFTPADKTTGEATTNINKSIEISNGNQFGIDTNSNSYAENGEIYFAANTASSSSQSLDYIQFTEQEKICTIFFRVNTEKSPDLTISQVTNDDFVINQNKDDTDFTSIALSDEEADLSSSGDGIIYADIDGDWFYCEEFDFTPQPEEKKVQSLSISGIAAEYIVGDKLDLVNVKVTKTYNDTPTTTEEVTLNSILSDTNYEVKIVNGTNENTLTADTTLSIGDSLKVSYIGTDKVDGEVSATQALTVREEKITKIEFQGFDTSYKQGDTIDLSKISVIATYEKSGDKILTSDKYTLTSTGNSIVGNEITLTNSGDTIITATLKEDTSKTATKTITIAEKQLIGIEVTAPTKDVYKVGDTLDLTGITVNAKYDNNGTETTEQVTTGYTTSITNGDKLNNAGVQTITVNYKGQTATFDIVVFPTKLVGTEEDSLSTVEVPEGFEWDNGNNTLSVGENTYLLKYTNTDPAKVKTNDVEVLGIPSNLTATYGETLADVKYKNGALPTGFSWTTPTTSVGDATDVGNEFDINYAGYENLKVKVKVNKAEEYTLTGITFVNKTETYDGNEKEITVTGTIPAGIVVNYTDNKGIEAEEYNATAIFTFDPANDAISKNYKAIKVDGQEGNTLGAKLTIDKATLVENNFALLGMPENNTKEYDGNPVTVTSTIKTEVPGADDIRNQVIVEYYKDGVKVTDTSAYGTYEVKVSVIEGNNYNAVNALKLGEFSVTKAVLDIAEITVTDPENNIYDGNEKIPTINIPDGAGTVKDIKYYDEKGTEVVSPTDAGTYTVKITTENATNYADITTLTEVGTFEIQKREITVKVADKSSMYGQDLEELTCDVTVGSIVLGDTLESILDLATVATETSNVGEYAITGTEKATNKNYDITFVDGTYEITQREITVTIQDKTSEYRKNLVELTGSVTIGSLATGDILENIVNLTTTATNTSNVGNYDITGSVNNNNYAVTFTNENGNSTKGKYEITRATLTAEDFDKTIPTNKEYDGSALTATASIKAGIVGAGTTVTVKYYKNGVETTNTSDYGTYIVKVNINEGENYFAADGTAEKPEIEIGSFSITKKQLALSDIEMTPKTFTYNGTKQTPNVTAKVSGAGTIVATYWQGATEVANPTDVGTYTVKITTIGATNYENITTPIEIGTYEITARPVTVTIDNKTSIYGDAIDTLTSNVTVGDVITGDDLGITLTKAEGTDVDEYAITGTATNTNYDVTFVDGKYTITARPITISIDNKESEIKDELVELTYQVTVGTVVGTDEAVVLETNANKDIVDTYDITVKSENSNYNVTIANTDEKAAYTVKDKVKEIKLSKDTIEANCGTSLEELINGITYTVVYEGAGEQTPVALTTAMIKTAYNENSTETQSLTVAYTDNDTNSATNGDTFEAILNVSLKDTLTSIRVENATLEYYEGQTFNADNKMEVTAEYSVADDKKVTNYIIKDKNGNILNRPLTQADSGIVTIEYEEDGVKVSKDITITVKPDVITDITFNFNGTTEYDFGDNIDLGTSTVTKVWASGKTENVSMTLDMLSITEKPSFDFANMNEIGTYNVKVTIDGKTSDNTFQITVKDAIESISIVDKTILEKDYNYNQAIDVTGGQISINYKSGNTVIEDITTGMLSGYSMTTVKDNQTVTVTYTDDKGNKYTDTFKINVKDAIVGIDITKEPIKKLYKLNEMQDFGDIEVTNVMASGNLGIKLVASEYTITGFDSTKVGEQTITVTKVGTTYTDTFKVKIIDVTTDMFISDLPKVNYKYGEGLSLAGGTITVKTEGNTVGTVIPMTDSSVTVTGYNPNRLGDQTLTVTYTYTEETETGVETRQKTDTYTVKVEDYETGVIITPPTKTTYDYGMPLDLIGATVSKVWASGKTTDTTEISGGMISEYSATTLGLQTIKVNAFGKENVGSFNVTVVDKTLGISMKKLPNKIEYTEGEGIDVTGAVLNVTKLSGTKEIPVTKEMISGYNPGKIGTQVITVTYDGFTTEFVVNVKEAEKKPNKPNRPVNPSKPATSEVDKYTVTFIDYDGSVIKTEEVEIGKSATAPKLEERKGYKFLGWDTNFEVVEKDIIVMAKYEEIIRAKVNAPDDMEVEKGEDLDLSDVTIEIFDGEGNRIDEIPVTKDMISGFDSEKVGTQIVRVTYIGEDGFEYTDTFKVRVKRPAEVLGVKDEAKTEEINLNGIIIPTAIGIGAIGILLLLIALVTRKNVEIYAITEDEKKLVGKEKITKNNRRIDLDEYEKKLAKSNIEIVLNKNITRKLDEEMVDIIFKGKKSTYKVKDIDNKEFSIKMKNA